MLLGNFNAFNANPGRALGGPNDPTLWCKSTTVVNFYTPSNLKISTFKQVSFPLGAKPPYSWNLAPTGGGLRLSIAGSGSINTSSRIYASKRMIGPLTGEGYINPSAIGLVKGMVSAITGLGTLGGTLAGSAAMIGAIQGLGTLTGSIGGIGELIGALNSSGDIVTNLTAIGFMVADISPYTPLSPESLAASLWNSLAAQYNTPGSMGNKLNAAGSATDPWGTALPGSYVEGTAGAIIGKDIPSIKGLTSAGL